MFCKRDYKNHLVTSPTNDQASLLAQDHSSGNPIQFEVSTTLCVDKQFLKVICDAKPKSKNHRTHKIES